ncbi:MAG TPA: TonB-dependent receptor [Sphingomonas sp.]
MTVNRIYQIKVFNLFHGAAIPSVEIACSRIRGVGGNGERIMTGSRYGLAMRGGVSIAAMTAALVFSSSAFAQTTAPASTADTVVDDQDTQDGEIVVVGSRASQQSSNLRKRNARTATDSIVADDIGSFPDRNVGEAISRIPGVALNRNDFGEGETVAVRGNGPDLTRVELDGIGVGSTGSLAIGNGGARTPELRELPAELVKSIDVIKGSTADMVEGSLGGTISVKTRTGLDFKRPYISLRAGAGMNSLGKKWTPDFNAVAATRLFDDRLGVIVSGTYAKIQSNGHGYEQTVSGNRGFAHAYDFDNSAEKTFTFNPATVGTDAADVAFANSTAPDGTTLTPRELVTLSAGATSKAQCLTIFPYLTATTATAAQINQRTNEQRTCLNQWNDATPSLVRNFMNTQTDKRYALDGRLDYRLTDELTVFAKGTYTVRNVHDQNRSRNPITLFSANVAPFFTDTPNGPVANGTQGTRTVSAAGAAAGYYLFDPVYGINNVTTTTAPIATIPYRGQVINVIPGSVVVDSEHNVTSMTLTNNTANIDQIENTIDNKSKFAQFGAEYRGERVEMDFMAGMTTATATRGDMRTNRLYSYGNATLTLQPNGLYSVELPSTYNDKDPNNFVQLANQLPQAAIAATINNPASPAFTTAQLPRVTPNFSVSYSPSIAETSEKIARFDVRHNLEGLVPFLTRFSAGAMYRQNKIDRWGGGGYTARSAVGTFPNGTATVPYQAPVVVPTANVRGSLRACEPTATSTVSCNYGFVPATNLSNIRSGVDTLTPQQLRDLITSTIDPSDSEYFGDLPNRGNLPTAWDSIRTDLLFAQLGASKFMNFDCVKTCTGSDGKTYDQPVFRAQETIKNTYFMIDFEQQLPLGLRFNGNAGVRGVFTDVKGSGLLTLIQIQKNAAFDPANPNAAGGINTVTFVQNATLDAKSTDWLPSFNGNLWGFNDSVVLRVYGGKTVARPAVSNLVPAGTCTIDQRQLDTPGEDLFGCTGRVGNPALKPFTAWSYNAALEWYPNADTLFSVAYGKLDVQIGSPIQVTTNLALLGGTDPATGASLAGVTFAVPTFDNGPGYKRDIIEFSAKTAFTFLPWFFKHMGFDANYAILSSAVTSGIRDPETGTLMPPANESKYTTNASLWYDDGKLNMRVAYQKRTEQFSCITPCSGGNNTDFNYPGEGYFNVGLGTNQGYNPGVPRYVDGTTFIDAKISYNVTKNFQVYVEGRNVQRESSTLSFGGFVPYADGTPKLIRLSYAGRRIMTGLRVQFGN